MTQRSTHRCIRGFSTSWGMRGPLDTRLVSHTCVGSPPTACSPTPQFQMDSPMEVLQYPHVRNQADKRFGSFSTILPPLAIGVLVPREGTSGQRAQDLITCAHRNVGRSSSIPPSWHCLPYENTAYSKEPSMTLLLW